jgi:adenine-specific DNA-methyltransferase
MNTEHTIDPTPVTSNSEQLAVLKQHFPHCFDKNGQFVLSRFEEVLQAHEVATTQESDLLSQIRTPDYANFCCFSKSAGLK